MIEPIDAIRSLRRESHSFERCISALTVAIGDIERLSKVEPDQLERLNLAAIRLDAANGSKGCE